MWRPNLAQDTSILVTQRWGGGGGGGGGVTGPEDGHCVLLICLEGKKGSRGETREKTRRTTRTHIGGLLFGLPGLPVSCSKKNGIIKHLRGRSKWEAYVNLFELCINHSTSNRQTAGLTERQTDDHADRLTDRPTDRRTGGQEPGRRRREKGERRHVFLPYSLSVA